VLVHWLVRKTAGVGAVEEIGVAGVFGAAVAGVFAAGSATSGDQLCFVVQLPAAASAAGGLLQIVLSHRKFRRVRNHSAERRAPASVAAVAADAAAAVAVAAECVCVCVSVCVKNAQLFKQNPNSCHETHHHTLEKLRVLRDLETIS